MTGCVIVKRTSSGKEYYYVRIQYKDPQTMRWKTKDVSTGLTVKGNKRKAEIIADEYKQKYAYLEQPLLASPEIDPKIELCDFLDQWLDEKKCDIVGNTYDTYKCRIVTIKRYFGNTHILARDVTPKDLQDCIHYLLQYGKVSQKDQSLHPLAVRTVRDCKILLNSALSDAVIKGILPTNPARDVKVGNKKNKDFTEEMLFLTEDEIREVFEFLDGDERYTFLKPIFFVGVYYGLRREEILGLKWSEVNYRQSYIGIRHTVTGSKEIYREDRAKTRGGYRKLTLFPTAETCFRKVKREQKEYQAFFGNAYHDMQDYVFTHDDGTPYRPDFLTKKFGKAMAAFGRPEITLHKLRHTCASLLIDKGWDIKKIQYWLGDDDASTVMNIYAHYMKHKSNLAENDLTEMTDNVADFFE